jgi:glyoxylase-like metal-dependent hydrolase (beta-lactamase superfamily II)
MLKRVALLVVVAGAFVLAVLAAGEQPRADKPKLSEMKFNEVAEVAPGVFFRYSSISATDKSVPFGGCNNVWVVFKDYVVVIDANFPKEAGDVLADLRKTTDKPIKYVLDTHHHGDHAYGNSVWAKEGAKIVAHTNAARLLKVNGPKQWADAAKDRKDLRETELKHPDIPFDDKYVVEDGTRRVEFLYLGHAHTPGDAVAYLPKEKTLCTGDACVNGSFNFMGHSDSGSWVKCLDRMEKLDVELVCPGHGPVARKDLLGKQRQYFADMREQVQKGIDAKKSLADITTGLEMGWYKDWTGVAAKDNKDNVKHVYDELTGKIDHDRLGLRPAPLDYLNGERKALAETAPAILRGPGAE